MLQYERIYISERIGINKSNKLKECMICYYWYFKDVGYKLNHISVIDVMIYQ